MCVMENGAGEGGRGDILNCFMVLSLPCFPTRVSTLGTVSRSHATPALNTESLDLGQHVASSPGLAADQYY